MTRNKRLIVSIAILVSLVFYYQLDYKRHFVSNTSKTKFITIWQRLGNRCFIIPGKYYGVFSPSDNFIRTVNYKNYVGVIWNTGDDFTFKLSIYNKFEKVGLENDVQVYSSNDSLLFDYGILETLDVARGKREKSINSDSLKRIFDYNYIDLNRVYGIKVHPIPPLD